MYIDNDELLPLVAPENIGNLRRNPIDDVTIEQVRSILDNVRRTGEEALRMYAEKFGDCKPDDPLILSRNEMERITRTVSEDQLALLRRTASRIRYFAEKQLACLSQLDIVVEGGRAGHGVVPVKTAGCYAPGGHYPLPSSVLMTVIPARVAGVSSIWAASPRPAPILVASAFIAGADALLAVGGAQAIAALAYGTTNIPRCDIVVGPGNRWVTAAKILIAGRVKIDMIAGPSELVVIADATADATIVALDLLAQAEHDVDALPILISPDSSTIRQARNEIRRLLNDCPTDIARQSLKKGFAVHVADMNEAADLANRIAPEHLQLSIEQPESLIQELTAYGGLFIGRRCSEVFGDYGMGPNHVLPTSTSARQTAGLSALTFIRLPTWLRMDGCDDAPGIVKDAVDLAKLEGLVWHARAAQARTETYK